jgi:hypothetical protein
MRRVPLVPAAPPRGDARTSTKGPSRLNADGSSAEDDVRTTPMSDTPGRGQTAERASACCDADRYGRGTPGVGIAGGNGHIHRNARRRGDR